MEQTTTTTPSTARLALKYGLLTALGLIIYSLIINLAGLDTNRAMTTVTYIITTGILVVGIIYAMREFRSQNGGYMSYGQGLGLGLLLSAVAGLISGIFSYIYLSFVDTNAMQRAMDMQRQAMEEQGVSDEQIDQAMAMAEKFATPGMAVLWSVVGMLFIGFILSLIISAIMKKDRPVEFS